MTDQERITQLEARIATLEARLATLERQPIKVYGPTYAAPATPMPQFQPPYVVTC